MLHLQNLPRSLPHLGLKHIHTRPHTPITASKAERLIHATPESGPYTAYQTSLQHHDRLPIWHFRHGALIAVDAIDDPRAFMVGKHLLAEDGTIDPAVIPDMSVDLKSLLPAKPGPGAGAAGQDGSDAD